MKNSRFEETIESGAKDIGAPSINSAGPMGFWNSQRTWVKSCLVFMGACFLLAIFIPKEEEIVRPIAGEELKQNAALREITDAQYQEAVEAIDEAKPDFGFNQKEFQKRLAEAESKIVGFPKNYPASAMWQWSFDAADHSYFTRFEGNPLRKIHVYVKAKSQLILQIHCRADFNPNAAPKEQFEFAKTIPLLISTALEPSESHEAHWENFQKLNAFAAGLSVPQQAGMEVIQDGRLKCGGMVIEFIPPPLKYSFYPAPLFNDDE